MPPVEESHLELAVRSSGTLVGDCRYLAPSHSWEDNNVQCSVKFLTFCQKQFLQVQALPETTKTFSMKEFLRVQALLTQGHSPKMEANVKRSVETKKILYLSSHCNDFHLFSKVPLESKSKPHGW